MNTTLKVISLLLSYPTAELQKEAPALKAALAKDGALGEHERVSLGRLADDIASGDLYDVQERYVLLFDRTRSLSLHLFEHVHGESRDRGQAMVDLASNYADDGFAIDAKELPDYLPLFLEYLSVKSAPDSAELLGQTLHILTTLKQRLKKRKSVYVHAFGVLETLARGKPDEERVRELLGMPEDDPSDLEALDRVWEDEVVMFGGNAGEEACGPDRLRTQMRAAARKPSDSSPISTA
ncbi:MAG: nitrate reductase molybdenum cofactor assembly chaperone [Alphaproteobacteria bacterium]|nr:nitrate reductase molybdenum cofactor assembly chaperone [Alphaproteobacteria bacterium]